MASSWRGCSCSQPLSLFRQSQRRKIAKAPNRPLRTMPILRRRSTKKKLSKTRTSPFQAVRLSLPAGEIAMLRAVRRKSSPCFPKKRSHARVRETSLALLGAQPVWRSSATAMFSCAAWVTVTRSLCSMACRCHHRNHLAVWSRLIFFRPISLHHHWSKRATQRTFRASLVAV